MANLPDHFDSKSKLAQLWAKPLSDTAALPGLTFQPEESERHCIYLLLLMAIVKDGWNGNKNGSRDGEYPSRAKQRRPDGSYLGDRLGDRYLGHNISAIAVDAGGRVVDFDFNHNRIFNSSVQHAEARLIRRMFGLAAVQDSWDLNTGDKKYRTDLKETTVYTSLESCAQCAGIMALGNVKSVIYLQPDPGQYMIGQIMRNLSDALAPDHVPASLVGLPHYSRLAQAYKDHLSAIEHGGYFWQSSKDPTDLDKGRAVTSFLCTDSALDVYADGEAAFKSFACTYPAFEPVNPVTAAPAMRNQQVLDHAKQFLQYVKRAGQRGTSHFN